MVINRESKVQNVAACVRNNILNSVGYNTYSQYKETPYNNLKGKHVPTTW